MRFNSGALVLLCVLGAAAEAQDRRDWQALAQLHAGDAIRLSLKTGPVNGVFQSFTPQEVTAGTVSARKEDVLKIERFHQSGWGRGEKIAVGALIGFGGGFVIGLAAGDPSCHPNEFVCLNLPRGVAGAAVGIAGAAVGAAVGALLPRHKKDLIYSAK